MIISTVALENYGFIFSGKRPVSNAKRGKAYKEATEEHSY